MKQYVEIFSALLTPVLAILALYIALQQWRTNHLKLRHDLYERRLAIYFALMEFLACIAQRSNVTDAELVTFLKKIRESCFLFDMEMADYLESLYKHAVDLQAQHSMLHDSDERLPIGEERRRVAHEKTELLKWFVPQFAIARTRFSKHMQMS